MKIQSVQRYAPFTHQTGTELFIPNSLFIVRLYPGRLHFKHLHNPHLQGSLSFSQQAPFTEFTAQLDLERGCVTVWGRGSSYFRYHLYGNTQTLFFYLQRGDLTPTIEGNGIEISTTRPLTPQIPFERLSLGVHKKQEWPLIYSRRDPEEIIPLLYAAGQWVNVTSPNFLNQGFLSLVPSLIPPDFETHFAAFFRAAFCENVLLLPKLEDEAHWGIALPKIGPQTTPLHLAACLFTHLRSLFFTAQEQLYSFLPQLPKAFHCGRLIGLQTQEAEIAIEWSKKLIRRVIVKAKTDSSIHLHFRHVKKMRLRMHKEKQVQEKEANFDLHMKAGSVYFLDNFQK